ncbi:MAG: PAS domain S-box protein [Candidatus Binatia bacterium]
MVERAAAVSSDPSSILECEGNCHIVQVYTNDAYLIDVLARFVGSGLGAGEAVVIIVTAEHRRELEEQLHARGMRVSVAREAGRYIALDTGEVLAQFMDENGPDEARFRAVVDPVLERAAASAPRLRVFGEMVAELCKDGRPGAAIALERMWNRVGEERSLSLLCAYPLAAFATNDDVQAFQAVCDAHGHVIPTEGYSALTHPDAQLRRISELEQRGRALESEIASRQAAENALDLRDGVLRALVDASPTAIVVIDADTTVSVWNPAAAQLFGWSPEEVVGRSLPIVPAEKLAECASMREAVARGERVSGVETYRLARDGSAVPVTISVGALAQAQAPGGMVLIFEDLRQRKPAEHARAQLAAIVESSDDAIVGKTLEGIITSWNRGAERLFGYTADEMVGRSIMRIVPSERSQDVQTILAAMSRGERVEHFETERVCKDGRRISVSLTVSPIRDSAGRIIGASKIARDVTERKRVEGERRAALRELSTLYRIGQTVYAELDRQRLLQTITDAATDLSGAQFGAFFYNSVDERGDQYLLYTLSGAPREAFEKFGAPRITQIFAPTFAGQGVVRLDDVRRDPRYGHNAPHRGVPEGHLPVTSYLAVPVSGRTGEVFGGLFLGHPEPGVFSEAAERIVVALANQAAIALDNARLYEAEQRARVAAEDASRAKDQFLAMLSHELRNPLSAVHNAIRTAELDPERRERALDIAHRGTDQLTRLVDDLLDVARITQGRISLRKATVPLSAVLERAIDSMRESFEDHSVAITLSLPARELEVEGDGARLEQVIGNLLSNAAKYTDPGGRITVTLEHEGNEAVLRIRDTGIGIPPDMLSHVFELFRQADQSLDRARGGLGIGLTLVKQLVELHGGRVEAHSEGAGKGAEFVVRLPAAVRAKKISAPSAPLATERHPPARVLIVEDNADAAESLRMLLELLGHRVRAVTDGPSALAAARANPPDVMIIDIGLPGMNGYDLAQAIRADEGLRRITLIALTGYGQEEDRQRSLSAGFDYHLVKPVDLEVFKRVVEGITPAKSLTVH